MRTNKSLSPNATVRPNLRKLARDWATPTVGMSTNGNLRRGGERADELLLAGQAVTHGAWATPTASEGSNRTTRIAPSHGKHHGRVLAGEAAEHGAHWATPIAADAKNVKAHARGNLSLTGQASQWPTPTTSDFKGSGVAGYSDTPGRRTGTTLTDAAVRQWPTPTTSDAKRGAQGDRLREGGPSLVTATNGHLGATTSPAGPGGRVLNPAFVEALMGLPGGWTDFGCSETGSCGSKPPARCATCTSGRGGAE